MVKEIKETIQGWGILSAANNILDDSLVLTTKDDCIQKFLGRFDGSKNGKYLSWAYWENIRHFEVVPVEITRIYKG